jgi:hypothetical protein
VTLFTALNRRVDLQAVVAGALLVGLLATSACTTAGAAKPKEVISDAPVCARRLPDGRVVEGPTVCASTPAR